MVKKTRSKTVRSKTSNNGTIPSAYIFYTSLANLPNKWIVSDFSVESLSGYSVNNPLKMNQDSYLIHKDLLTESTNIDYSLPEYQYQQVHLFAVWDGHGDDGHSVSGFIKSKLANNIIKVFKQGFFSINEILDNAVTKTDTDIEKAPLDSYNSGSTLTGVLIKGNSLYPFNVGDSRTILIQFKSEEDRKDYMLEKHSKIISDNLISSKIEQSEEHKRSLLDSKRLSALSYGSIMSSPEVPSSFPDLVI